MSGRFPRGKTFSVHSGLSELAIVPGMGTRQTPYDDAFGVITYSRLVCQESIFPRPMLTELSFPQKIVYIERGTGMFGLGALGISPEFI